MTTKHIHVHIGTKDAFLEKGTPAYEKVKSKWESEIKASTAKYQAARQVMLSELKEINARAKAAGLNV